MFSLELSIGETVFRAEAESIAQAFEKLGIERKHVLNVFLLKVKKGKLKAEIKIYPRVMRRLLVNDLSRRLLEKRLLTLLR